MNNNAPELIFPTRHDFRNWLIENAAASEGVWLVFSKAKNLATLTANEALEEALCFGWIDGLMKSVDSTRYVKYFARRQSKSVWSEKNKQTIQILREKGLLTEMGERAVFEAVKNGNWDAEKPPSPGEDQIEALVDKLRGFSPAFENFMKMSPSIQRTYTRAFLAPKSESARDRALERIVDRLNKNLKPM